MVKVRFYDHTWGNTLGLITCTVVGEIIEEFSDKTILVLRCWKSEGEDDVFDPFDGNQEYACIVRSTIIEMSHLVEMSEIEVLDCAEA